VSLFGFIVATACLTYSIVGQTGYKVQIANLKTEKANLITEMTELQTNNDNLAANITALEGEKITLENAEATLESQKQSLTSLTSELSSTVEAFRTKMCPQSWSDLNSMVFWLPLQEQYISGISGHGLREWYVTWTQWDTSSKWEDSLFSTTILWDEDGDETMVIDTENDCFIPNPEFWPASVFP
jgi:hypothetical protein